MTKSTTTSTDGRSGSCVGIMPRRLFSANLPVSHESKEKGARTPSSARRVYHERADEGVRAPAVTWGNARWLALASLIFFLVRASLHASEITVFAAASLTDSLKEITASYEKRSTDKIIFNFGASSTLARQIEEGAPADIFFSADEARMDGLEKKGLIERGTRKSRLGNTLVIVTAADGGLALSSPQELAEPKVKRIALADPKAVPAGIYAKAWLEKIRLWSVVEPKVVPTENVRAALAAVESGNVEAGIVYKTDAGISKKVKISCEVPAKDTPDISYPMALVKESKQPEAAKRFLNYLGSKEAGDIFKKFGFIVRD